MKSVEDINHDLDRIRSVTTTVGTEITPGSEGRYEFLVAARTICELADSEESLQRQYDKIQGEINNIEEEANAKFGHLSDIKFQNKYKTSQGLAKKKKSLTYYDYLLS